MKTQIAGDSLPLKFIATGTKTGLPKPLEMMYEKGRADYKTELLKALESMLSNERCQDGCTFCARNEATNDIIELIKREQT